MTNKYRRLVVFLLILALAVTVMVSVQQISKANAGEAVIQLTAEEQTLLDLINKERVSRGLKPFQVDMRLVGTSRAKATDMAVNKYFSHTSPTLGTPYNQMRKAGISGYYMLGAENIAFARSVQQAHYNFMHSPGHKRNLLDPRHTHIGIGVVNGSYWGKVVVEHFAGK